MSGKAKSGKQNGDGTGTVARTTMILRAVAEADDAVSIKSLVAELGLAPSTVHRLLHLLIGQGFVEQSPNGHTYRAGAELFRLGALVVDRWKVPAVALPYMRNVVEACDEFCMLNLYVPSGGCMIIAETVVSSHPLNYGAEKFVHMPLTWGATGKAILAFLPEKDIQRIYDQAERSPADGRTLPSYAQFSHEMKTIRARGYAHTVGQKMPGAVGIAAPVFGASGNVEGSLSLTVPEIRFQASRAQVLSIEIVKQAAALSYALGHRPAHAGTVGTAPVGTAE